MAKGEARKTARYDAFEQKTRRIFCTRRVVVIVKHNHDLSADYAARVIMVNVFDRSRHCPLHQADATPAENPIL